MTLYYCGTHNWLCVQKMLNHWFFLSLFKLISCPKMPALPRHIKVWVSFNCLDYSICISLRHTQQGIGSQIWLHLVFSACLLSVNPQLESLSFQKGWTVFFQNTISIHPAQDSDFAQCLGDGAKVKHFYFTIFATPVL